jgi:hypothetical protein
LERREGQWHVVNEDGASEGSHSSRADAIKHQRHLYANQSRVASMYADLDAHPVPEVVYAAPLPVVQQSSLSPLATELVGLLLKDDRERSLVASVAESQAMMQQQQTEDRQALIAALGRMGSPVVNVPAPEVTVNVPAAEVNFTVPPAEVTVNVPDVHVSVAAPEVTVRPEIVLPSSQKTVTFERDPLTQQVTKAEVTEG